MYNIDTDDAVGVLPPIPAAGTEKFFQDTDPTGGTILPAWWVNMIQGEIRNVVVGAGLTPNKSSFSQLKAAIDALIASGGGGGAGGGSGYGTKAGMITEPDSGDTDHDIRINIGVALDSNGVTPMKIDTPVIKKIDEPWAPGSGFGGFPSAGGSGLTLSPNTWYHLFVIAKPGGADVDAGWDTNLDASVLLNGDNAGADGYTLFRRVASILTDGTSNIIPYIQIFNYFEHLDDSADTAYTNSGLQVVRSPLGVKTKVDIGLRADGNAGGTAIIVSHPDSANTTRGRVWSQAADGDYAIDCSVLTDELSQIRIISAAGADSVSGSVRSWQDFFELDAYNAVPGGGGGQEVWQEITANHAAVAGEYLMITENITITLPANPSPNDKVVFAQNAGDLSANPTTIDGGSNDISRNGIEADATTYELDVNFVGRQTLVFIGGKWQIT